MGLKINKNARKELRNEDPISGEPGAHPVGTGLGAALGGAAAGALAGAMGGPVGAVAGAAVGAVAGGLGGKAVAEEMNPTLELAYWESNYKTRDYYDPSLPYSEYRSAYQFAIDNYRNDFSRDKLMDQLEDDVELRSRWESTNPKSQLTWENVKRVLRDTWNRLAGSTANDDCCKTDPNCRTK